MQRFLAAALGAGVLVSGLGAEAFMASGPAQFGFGGGVPVYLGNQVHWQSGLAWRPYVRFVPVMDYMPVPYRYPVTMPMWGMQYPMSPQFYNPMFPMMPMRFPFMNPFANRGPGFSRGRADSYEPRISSRYSPRSSGGADGNGSASPPAAPSADSAGASDSAPAAAIVPATEPVATAQPTVILPSMPTKTEAVAPPPVEAPALSGKKEEGAPPPVPAGPATVPAATAAAPAAAKPVVFNNPVKVIVAVKPSAPSDDADLRKTEATATCSGSGSCSMKIVTPAPPVPELDPKVCETLKVAYQNCDACKIEATQANFLYGYYWDQGNGGPKGRPTRRRTRSDGIPQEVSTPTVANSHPYLKSNSELQHCPQNGAKLANKSLLFNLRTSGQPGPSINANKINLHPRSQSDRYGVDCSEWVSTLLAAKGWKVKSNEDPKVYQTTDFIEAFFDSPNNVWTTLKDTPDPNACFGIVNYSKQGTVPLAVGDIFVRGAKNPRQPGHTMMIAAVKNSEKPYDFSGVECTVSSITDKFDQVFAGIYVTQSNNSYGGVGPMVTRLTELFKAGIFNDGRDITDQYKNLFVNMALNAMRDDPSKGCLPKRCIGADEHPEKCDDKAIAYFDKDTNAQPAFIMRHNSGKKGCTTSPYSFENTECVKQCLHSAAGGSARPGNGTAGESVWQGYLAARQCGERRGL